jgi:hypothetical protein
MWGIPNDFCINGRTSFNDTPWKINNVLYNCDDHAFVHADEWSWNMHHIHWSTGRAR